jgi:hypothetical protein
MKSSTTIFNITQIAESSIVSIVIGDNNLDRFIKIPENEFLLLVKKRIKF